MKHQTITEHTYNPKPRIRLLCHLIDMRSGECADWWGYYDMIPYCYHQSFSSNSGVLTKSYRDIEMHPGYIDQSLNP